MNKEEKNKKNKKIDEDKDILQSRLKERRAFLKMSYQDLADRTGLSKSTLQRYETGGIMNLPYDKVLVLSEALEVSPSYFTDLSKDYTGASDTVIPLGLAPDRTAIVNRMKELEEKAIQQITPVLISSGYTVSQCNSGSVGDLIATKVSEVWYIDFLYRIDVSRYATGTGMSRQQLLLRFGRLAVFDKPITKYSIVVENHMIARELIQKMRPIHLNIRVSVILLKDDGYEEFFFDQV